MRPNDNSLARLGTRAQKLGAQQRQREQKQKKGSVTVQVGDRVMRRPQTFGKKKDAITGETEPMRGTVVVYVHPKGRFHTVEFATDGGAIRESFLGVWR